MASSTNTLDRHHSAEHVSAAGVVPDSPASLFGSFAGAAVVGQAAAAFDQLGDAREWQRWTSSVLEQGRMVGPLLMKGPNGWESSLSGARAEASIAAFGTREGAVWRIEVSPGSIAIRRRDLARMERAAERALAARETMVKLRVSTGIAEDKDLGKRTSIRSWSAKSRANMVRRLATLDYAPLTAQGFPAMVTLTYPADWLTVAPSAAVCAQHLRLLQLRFKRAWGRKMIGVWKREFQRRGAPHYHLLMVPPAGKHNGQDFKTWLSHTWAAIVGHPDPEEYRRHVLAGTNVDVREGARYADPRRVGVYFSKHGSFSAKDYQNEAPAEWLADDSAGIGRFWGVWGLTPAVGVVEVDADTADAVRRTARRWQAATALRDRDSQIPATVKRTVWRKVSREVLDPTTGELRTVWKWRKRKVNTRIRPHLSGRAGFLCVNDGPGLALDLARFAALRSSTA